MREDEYKLVFMHVCLNGNGLSIRLVWLCIFLLIPKYLHLLKCESNFSSNMTLYNAMIFLIFSVYLDFIYYVYLIDELLLLRYK